MKIKKVDDKQMVIHTKKKATLHTVRSRRISVKGRNVLTVERGHRIRRAYIRPAKKLTSHNRIQAPEKDMESKQSMIQSTSKAAANEQRTRGNIWQNRAQSQTRHLDSYPGAAKGSAQSRQNVQYGLKQVSIEQKIKKKATAVTLAAAAATSKTAEQLDGDKEIKDAASVSKRLTNPLLSAGSKGAQFFKEKTLEERKRRIKVVEQRKTIDQIKLSGRRNLRETDHSIYKNNSADDSRDNAVSDQKQDLADTKRKHRYYMHKKYKQQNKCRVAKRKNLNISISAEPLYTAKGHAYTSTSDYRASREIKQQDAAVVTRKRKIRQYVNQLAVENHKSETILKKSKNR